ncbi:MAG: site-specific integrase [Alkaliphilus sp.]
MQAEKKEVKILNQEEVLILLKNLKEPLRLVVLIAINTGLRRGEILGLEWSNVDFENKKIHIVNAGRRAISISKSLISELKKTMTKQKENKLWFGADYFENDYVCVWENGKEINHNYITQAFRKSIMKLEIPHIRLHDLRHTHASLLLQKGIHPKIVQERLGHSKISITLDTYSHLLFRK